MQINKAGQVLYTQEEAVTLLMNDFSYTDFFVENANELNAALGELDIDRWLIEDEPVSITEWDKANQAHWFTPEPWVSMDIKAHILSLCRNEEDRIRTVIELTEYEKRDMLSLLKWLTYLTTELKKNNVVWGIGRGSSVASHVLFLIGLHSVDAIAYDLDFYEFMR